MFLICFGGTAWAVDLHGPSGRLLTPSKSILTRGFSQSSQKVSETCEGEEALEGKVLGGHFEAALLLLESPARAAKRRRLGPNLREPCNASRAAYNAPAGVPWTSKKRYFSVGESDDSQKQRYFSVGESDDSSKHAISLIGENDN